MTRRVRRTPMPRGSWSSTIAAALTATVSVIGAWQAPASLRVIVTDDLGQPVPRAAVALALDGVRVRTMAADAAGRVDFSSLAAGTYALEMSKPGYAATRLGAPLPYGPGAAIPLDAGQQRSIRARLPRGGAIVGTIRDVDGGPMPGAQVIASRWSVERGRHLLQYAESASANSQGDFRLPGLAAGGYILAFTPADGRGPLVTIEGTRVVLPTRYFPDGLQLTAAASIRVMAGQTVGGIDFTATPVPEVSISGSVVNPTAMTTGPAAVAWRSADRDGRAPQQSWQAVDGDGRFALVGVPPGHLFVRASAQVQGRRGENPPPLWAFAPIVSAGEPVTTTLTLQPGVSLTGRYVFDGGAPPGTWGPVALRSRGGPFADLAEGQIRDISTATGFLLLGVPPGEYAFALEHLPEPWSLLSIRLAGRDVTDEVLTITTDPLVDSLVVTLTNRQTMIEGVVAAAAGRERFDAPVVIFPVETARRTLISRRIRLVPTDVDGRYVVRNLPPGDYFLVAQPIDWDPSLEPERLSSLEANATRATVASGATVRLDLVGR